jgi:hypothetical protein
MFENRGNLHYRNELHRRVHQAWVSREGPGGMLKVKPGFRFGKKAAGAMDLRILILAGNSSGLRLKAREKEFMNRPILYLTFLLLFLCPAAFAGDSPAPGEDDSLLAFLAGSYDVIGRYPENGKTYWGTVVLERRGDSLMMVRNIRGKKTEIKASIVSITADAIRVLQADFTQNGRNLRVTYSIGSDADNYARLTGRVYVAGRETGTPGMEALFIRRPRQ